MEWNRLTSKVIGDKWKERHQYRYQCICECHVYTELTC